MYSRDRMVDKSVSETNDQIPTECGVCRGLGKLISNAGGEPHEVPCPWCEGTTKFIPEHDAQEKQREKDQQK